jgi:small subunit ribosomal protein S20
MANTSSAKKAARQAAKRTEVNKARKSRVRTYVRKVEEAIASGDKSAAAEALKAAQPILMSSTHKGTMHKNTAARKISRLAHRIKAIAAGA